MSVPLVSVTNLGSNLAVMDDEERDNCSAMLPKHSEGGIRYVYMQPTACKGVCVCGTCDKPSEAVDQIGEVVVRMAKKSIYLLPWVDAIYWELYHFCPTHPRVN